jgi:hypothetical protein
MLMIVFISARLATKQEITYVGCRVALDWIDRKIYQAAMVD